MKNEQVNNLALLHEPSANFGTRVLRNGLIIAVTALPTHLRSGKKGLLYEHLGGVGETKVGEGLCCLYNQYQPIKSGEMQRELAADLGYRDEPSFVHFRTQLLQNQDYSFERKTDTATAEKAITLAKEHGLAFGISKLLLFHLLYRFNVEDNLDMPGVIGLGVTALDDIAASRYQYRQALKSGYERPIEEIQAERAERVADDRNLYHGAWPDLPIYNLMNLSAACHVLLTNNENVSTDETVLKLHYLEMARSIHQFLITTFPETGDVLNLWASKPGSPPCDETPVNALSLT